MRKMLLLGALLASLPACQVPERAYLPPPLPDKVTPRPYAELLSRARAQATLATNAFYVNNFTDVEESARGLEQTAQYLGKAEDVPAKHKDTLATLSTDLGKLAKSLSEAAAVKDVKKTTDIMGKLQVKVREMRLSD